MRYFLQALLKSFLAGILATIVWLLTVLLAIFVPFFHWGMLFFLPIFLHIVTYILRRKKLKKKPLLLPLPELDRRKSSAIKTGYVLLPFLLLLIDWQALFFIFFRETIDADPDFGLVFAPFLIMISVIFASWCLLSWQWARYCLQDLAMQDKID